MKSKEFPKNILNEFKDEKEKYHFIIITSDTENYFRFENIFYKYSNGKKSIKGVDIKRNRELDLNKVKEVFEESENKKDYYLLREYDFFKKLIEEMNSQQFKYVSYVYGGYKKIHSFAMNYKIDLLEHGKKCFLCQEKQEEKIEKFGFLSFFWS